MKRAIFDVTVTLEIEGGSFEDEDLVEAFVERLFDDELARVKHGPSRTRDGFRLADVTDVDVRFHSVEERDS
jgi:hypothetical protein